MLFFLFVATISTLLMFAAGQLGPTAPRLARMTLVAAAVMVPVVVAGIRDVTVGTDVQVYLVPMIQTAHEASLPDYLACYDGISAWGFNILVWLTCQMGGMPLAMAAIQLLCVAPCYAEFWRQGRAHAWVGALVYCLMLFPASLNTMKQFVALGICLFCFRYVQAHRPVQLFIGVLVAMQFHQTAALFAATYPLYLLIETLWARPERRASVQWALSVGVLGVGPVVVLFALLPPLLEFASALKPSYAYFANARTDDLNKSALVMLAVVLICSFKVLHDSYSAEERSPIAGRDVAFFATMSTGGLAAFQLSMVAYTLMRLGFTGVFFLPCLTQAIAASNARFRGITLATLLVFYLAYFVVAVVLNGGYGVYPFTSALLGVA